MKWGRNYIIRKRETCGAYSATVAKPVYLWVSFYFLVLKKWSIEGL